MMNSAILRRGLVTTTSGAAAVTLASWCGERTASRTTSRVASRAVAQWHLSPRNLPATGRTFSSSTTSTSTTSTTAATATKSAVEKQAESSQKSFVQWYEGHLEARPILTKAVTGSILWGIGDVVAQVFPHLSEGSLDTLDYDWMRTGRAVTFGGVIHAPTSHLHFNFLEWMTVRTGFSGLQIPIFKTFMEQFVYWSWISNSMYHAAMGAMQGQGPQEIYDRICDLLMDMQKAQWAFWIPVQLVNFNFVPVRHQLNVVLLTSIVWTALLSMWYPPIKAKASEVTPE